MTLTKQCILWILGVLAGLPLVFALTINFNAPKEAILNEPFSVSVSADSQETYDVKIYVKNLSDTVLSDIFNDTWKSSRYYVNNAFPSLNSFKLRVEKFSESAEICIKFRLSEKRSSSPTPEKCNPIQINNNNNNADSPAPEERIEAPLPNASPLDVSNNKSLSNSRPVSEEKKSEKKQSQRNVSLIQPLPDKSRGGDYMPEDSGINQDVITLSYNISPILLGKKIVSPQQKSRLYALYIFTTLVFLIIILYLLRKI